MDGLSQPFLKATSEELNEAIKEEVNKRRLARLRQVRYQAREEATRIRSSVKREDERQKEILRKIIRDAHMQEKKEKLKKYEEMYTECFANFGQAHANAIAQEKLLEENTKKKHMDARKAAIRGAEALAEASQKVSSRRERELEMRATRAKVKAKENKRAAFVASKPTPTKFKPKKAAVTLPPKKMLTYDANTNTTSNYVPFEVQVVKETQDSKANGFQSALRERDRFHQVESLKARKEKEAECLVQERARVARLKMRQAKEYDCLLEGLRKADEEHDLSKFLQPDEVVEFTAEIRKKEAHEKASRILASEHTSGARVKFRFKDQIEDKETVDCGVIRRCSPPTLDVGPRLPISSNEVTDIHFRETVPVADIQKMEDKFCVKDAQIQTDSRENVNSESSIPTAVNQRNLRLSNDLLLPSNRKAQGSVALKQALIETSTSNSSQISSSLSHICKTSSSDLHSEPADNWTDEENIFRKMDALTRTSKKPVNNLKATQDDISVTSSRTQYKNLPTEGSSSDIPHSDLKYSNVAQNKRNERFPANNSTNFPKYISENDNSGFVSPRVYIKEIKTDGLGERPRPRREKFEDLKRTLLKHYIPRLLQSRVSEFNDETSSSGQSGVDLSSVSCIQRLIKINEQINASKENQHLPLSASLNKNHSRQSSLPESTSISFPSSFNSETFSSFSDASNLKQSDEAMNSVDFEKAVLLRLEQLQLLKEKVLASQMNSRNRLLNVGPAFEKSSSDSREMSSTFFSPVTTSTDSSDETANFHGTRKTKDQLTMEGFENGNRCSQNSVNEKSGQNVLDSRQITYSSSCDDLNRFSRSHSQENSATSQCYSIPDMRQIFDKFGLPWAETMIRKMDQADDNQTTDSTAT